MWECSVICGGDVSFHGCVDWQVLFLHFSISSSMFSEVTFSTGEFSPMFGRYDIWILPTLHCWWGWGLYGGCGCCLKYGYIIAACQWFLCCDVFCNWWVLCPILWAHCGRSMWGNVGPVLFSVLCFVMCFNCIPLVRWFPTLWSQPKWGSRESFCGLLEDLGKKPWLQLHHCIKTEF